jgi:hypothetical protein
MAGEWDDFDAAIERAGRRTDDDLASRVSSLTRLTDDEVKELFPKPADVERLAALMAIVKGAESRNRRAARIVANVEDLAGTIVTLLEKVA